MAVLQNLMSKCRYSSSFQIRFSALHNVIYICICSQQHLASAPSAVKAATEGPTSCRSKESVTTVPRAPCSRDSTLSLAQTLQCLATPVQDMPQCKAELASLGLLLATEDRAAAPWKAQGQTIAGEDIEHTAEHGRALHRGSHQQEGIHRPVLPAQQRPPHHRSSGQLCSSHDWSTGFPRRPPAHVARLQRLFLQCNCSMRALRGRMQCVLSNGNASYTHRSIMHAGHVPWLLMPLHRRLQQTSLLKHGCVVLYCSW